MNPARTFGSARLPEIWTALWIYFVAPPLGMMAAAAVYARLNRPVPCAKYHHENNKRCIFCEYQQASQQGANGGHHILDGVSVTGENDHQPVRLKGADF
jgi:glycerol uptake facilitator-like aquaporin